MVFGKLGGPQQLSKWWIRQATGMSGMCSRQGNSAMAKRGLHQSPHPVGTGPGAETWRGLKAKLPDFSLRGLSRQSWSPSTCLVLLVLIFSVDGHRWTSPKALHPMYCRSTWELTKPYTRPGPTLLIQLRLVGFGAGLLYFLNAPEGIRMYSLG